MSCEGARPHRPGGGQPADPARPEADLWRRASATVSAGNRVRLLRDGPQTFGAMLRAIDGARDGVALENYIVRSDAVGERFADALEEAAARDVRVRVLADWVGSRGTSRRYWRRLREAGIELHIFSKIGPRRWLGLLPRNHRKLLVVDDAIAITGGSGLGDEWDPARARFGFGTRWRDTAVQVSGPAVGDMMRSFEAMWARAHGRSNRAASGSQPCKRQPGRDVLAPSRADADENKGQASQEGALVGIVEGEPGRLRMARGLHAHWLFAERTIWIATAYFFPLAREVDALTEAAGAGVDVRLLLPSQNDHPWVTRLARRYYPRLLAGGVRVWEWRGQMMHAKSSVIDDRWVRIGSTDLNPLSFGVNYELDVIIRDDGLGREAAAAFLADLERSREIRAAPL